MDHKRGGRVNRKSGIRYHYIHIYRILCRWGFKQKMPIKVHVNTASSEEKERGIQKKVTEILVDKYIPEQEQPQEQKEDSGFTVVSLDESFFFYDSLVRRVWIVQDKRPIVQVTGSHQHSCIFGAISTEERKQLFRHYDVFNSDTFLEFLKKIHAKFQKCYLFMDKASQHYRSKKVIKYFEENKDTLIPVYFPTASPEFMVMEEIWNIDKRDLLILKYASFGELKNKVSRYFRTKRFNLNMKNYLLRDVRYHMLIGIY